MFPWVTREILKKFTLLIIGTLSLKSFSPDEPSFQKLVQKEEIRLNKYTFILLYIVGYSFNFSYLQDLIYEIVDFAFIFSLIEDMYMLDVLRLKLSV